MAEYLVLVDGNDTPVGTGEKVECHLPRGRLHRAFTALLFDRSGRLILARRSASKMLWPGFWDGTFASHPRASETYVEAAERRMPQEMGASCRMDYLFKFEYHVPYRDVGSENEVCGTVIGTVDDETAFDVVSSEVSEIARASSDQLLDAMAGSSASYCPWMLIALYLLTGYAGAHAQKYGSVLSRWSGARLRSSLQDAVRRQLADEDWRRLD